jgi:ATP adenylyltransferase
MPIVQEGNSMQPKECCLCAQLRGISENDLISTMAADKDYVRRVALEGRLFAVIPSIGPLTRGHSLLCPKRHFRSLAQLPPSYDEECAAMTVRLVGLLSDLYGVPVHCFEHGTAAAGSRVLCTVDHAHLHLVPTDATVVNVLQRDAAWLPVGPALQDLRHAVGEDEYIYYCAPEGTRLVRIATDEPIPSQYMRRVMGEAIGKGDLWDWRAEPRISETIGTFDDIVAFATGRATQ